jgi:subtilisin-like proprotein convertase family protein
MKTDNCYRLTCSLVALLIGLTLGGSAWAAQKVGANCLTGGGTNCVAPIPDGSTAGSTALNSTITIPAGSCPTVSRVCVATNIEHSSRGDLTVQLLHGARTHTLVPASGDTAADISRAFVLETEFDGVNGAGPWNLSITDSTNGDYGALNNWTLGLCCGTGCGNGLVLVTPNGALQTTEAGGTANFNVELTCPAFNQVTIPVSSSDTTEGTTPTTSLVFTAANSQNPQTVTFTGRDDALLDGNITYKAVLGTVAVGAPFATAVSPADLYNPPSVFQAAGNLPDVSLVNLDNEVVPASSLTINNVSKVEGNSGSSPLTFTVSLTPARASTVTVNYATANGSATAGSDYTATNGTLTFTAGQTSKTVTVNVTGDTTIEPHETFVVNLSGAVGATIADGQGVGTITNDDSPALRINNVSKVEGNSGSSALTFTVSLTPTSTGTVTVNYATANGSATAGSDYIATSGAMTFSPGQTSNTVTVEVVGDTAIEPTEAFLVNLSSASGATIADGQGVGTVTNDDIRTLRINDVKRGEGNSGSSTFVFTVSLTQAGAGTVTVNYATANGNATAGSDYTATSGALTFSPGQMSKTVTVNVTGDTVLEPNETFVMNLSGAVGATISDGQGIGTILNDEGLVLRVSDVSLGEGNSGTTAFIFTVSLTEAAKTTVTVDYATANGTATAGSDYAAKSGTLTFGPGQASQTVVVSGFGDRLLEPNETFTVNLSNASGATIFDDQGVGMILNDEGSVLRINDVSKAEGNSGTSTFIFTVTLSSASASPVTVNYATANGSALAGSDYMAVPLMPLTFSAGQTSKTVVVNVTGDTTSEPNETFVVNLSTATGATIFDGQGLGTILTDDTPSR